jgi:hypothetical protein
MAVDERIADELDEERRAVASREEVAQTIAAAD